MGMGMGMALWEWEGMGVWTAFPHTSSGDDLAVVLVKHGCVLSRTTSTTESVAVVGPAQSLWWPWTVAWNRGNSDAPAGACYLMMMIRIAKLSRTCYGELTPYALQKSSVLRMAAETSFTHAVNSRKSQDCLAWSAVYSCKSSAYWWYWIWCEVMTSPTGEAYTENNKGPKTEPWGTPDEQVDGSVNSPQTVTYWDRPETNDLSQWLAWEWKGMGVWKLELWKFGTHSPSYPVGANKCGKICGMCRICRTLESCK